jgi:hypothetical protein
MGEFDFEGDMGEFDFEGDMGEFDFEATLPIRNDRGDIKWPDNYYFRKTNHGDA